MARVPIARVVPTVGARDVRAARKDARTGLVRVVPAGRVVRTLVARVVLAKAARVGPVVARMSIGRVARAVAGVVAVPTVRAHNVQVVRGMHRRVRPTPACSARKDHPVPCRRRRARRRHVPSPGRARSAKFGNLSHVEK